MQRHIITVFLVYKMLGRDIYIASIISDGLNLVLTALLWLQGPL